MSKKEAVSAIAAALPDNFDKATRHAAAKFLHTVEVRRKCYKPDDTELSPERLRLERQIIEAFADVTCYREVRVLLGARRRMNTGLRMCRRCYPRWRNARTGRIFPMICFLPVPARRPTPGRMLSVF